MSISDTITDFVDRKFGEKFGEHRRQEITRLLFEIAKREECESSQILEDFERSQNDGSGRGNGLRFDPLKAYLMQRRFPTLSRARRKIEMVLPKLEILPEYRAPLGGGRNTLVPDRFFVEESVWYAPLVRRLKQKFPETVLEKISTYREHAGRPKTNIDDYNNRLKNFYLVKEKFDFFKKCPCGPKSVSCGYHVVNLGSGCSFECAYCYLQNYINSRGIILPANLEDFFEEFKRYHLKNRGIRLGAGELTDSLVFDHLTEYSPRIVEFFKDYPDCAFEFKTKSTQIDLLLSVRPAGNIVVSWSVNPPKVVETTEFLTATLEERLAAAQRCVQAGYKAGFHFDPVIYYPGWEEDYRGTVNEIFDRIPAESIAWISLGTLRLAVPLKKIIENRFPENTILDEEFAVGYDGKLRYPADLRADIYKKMGSWIRRRSDSAYFYLCMEEQQLCRASEAPPLKRYMPRE